MFCKSAKDEKLYHEGIEGNNLICYSHNYMDLHLDKLKYAFTQKPLLVGGKAMEYYGLRKAGNDIDLIVPEQDVVALIKQYPSRVKDLWGDLGVCPFEFEIWRTICFFNYEYLKEGAIDKGEFLVISLEKLLFMKALGYKKEKYLKDVFLIVDNIIKKQSEKQEEQKLHNFDLLKGISDINYIEKTGPAT